MKEEQLVKKIENLNEELQTLIRREPALRDQLGAMILDGKDTKNVETELSQTLARKEGVKAAIKHAEQVLENLRAEKAAEERRKLKRELNETIENAKAEHILLFEKTEELWQSVAQIRDNLQSAKDRATAAKMEDQRMQSGAIIRLSPVLDLAATVRSFEKLTKYSETLKNLQD
jgi:hypothetical protein